METLHLKAGKEKPLLRRHPWVFASAVAGVTGLPMAGETVKIVDAGGRFIAWAAYNPHSKICARVWSWEENQVIGPDFFQKRLLESIRLRQTWTAHSETTAIRLVHAESDGLPGLIVDRYGEVLVIQVLSAGIEQWRGEIISQLIEIMGADCIYERSDVDVRALEGLPECCGLIYGTLNSPKIKISEAGLSYWVDLENGHKTGFYLDQRDNRIKVRQLAQGRDVLDCFCYTGGFTLNALAGGATSVVSIDSSEVALQLGRENLALNQLPPQVEWLEGDVFQILRKFRDSDRKFDLIVLDPPKFAPTIAQVDRAARGYKDINLLAFKLLRPGGILVTFSCSGGVNLALFQQIVAGAALDAGVDAHLMEWLHQAPDHPVSLNFPEGEYLKGLILQVN